MCGFSRIILPIVNLIQKGDIAITQDYGLAAMCLGKRAVILNQDGREYTIKKISGLLEFRAVYKKIRHSGGRLKNVPMRNGTFEKTLGKILNKFQKNGIMEM